MTSYMTSRDLERSRSFLPISLRPVILKMAGDRDSVIMDTYRKWHARYRMVTLPMISRDHSIP